jgi:hypothetical protein
VEMQSSTLTAARHPPAHLPMLSRGTWAVVAAAAAQLAGRRPPLRLLEVVW